MEIYEPGPGDLDPNHIGVCRQGLDYFRCERPRIHAGSLGMTHRHVGSIVAVRRVSGPFNLGRHAASIGSYKLGR
jgi:hypothetical protein